MINKLKAEGLEFKTEGLDIGFDFDVAFQENQKINCIIGKNGIGKTQLLENIAKSLIYMHTIFLTDWDNQFKRIRSNRNITTKKIEELGLKLPRGIELNGVNVKDNTNQIQQEMLFGNISIVDIQVRQESLFEQNVFIFDKPIVFIGAKNRGFTKNINPENIKILGNVQDRFVESIERTMSYINGDGLEREEVANWFVSRLIVNPNFVLKGQDKANEVITVLQLIEKLEPTLKLVVANENGGNSISMLFHEGQLLFNGIPLNKLSTGFVSIVKIFQEIVAGYGGWSSLDDLSLVDGVVFIDEIEAHLHISWQTKIINILKDYFSNTTFYITTHSPLVLAGLKDGEAYELYKADNFVKAKAITHVEHYALNDIVNEFFGVDLNQEKVENPNLEKQKKARALLLNLTKSLKGNE